MRVHRSMVIDAPIDVVWAAIRRFDGVGDWNPGVARVWMESGAPTEVGGVRHIELPDGGLIVETLLGHSDADHHYRYRIDESPLPVAGYEAEHRLQEVTVGGRTFSTWTAEFDLTGGTEAELDALVGDGIFVGGMQGLTRHVGA